MKAYYYKEEETPIKPWPSGLLRLEGVDVVEDPDAADVLVVPPPLYSMTPDQVRGLRHMKGREARHVFFQCSDHDQTHRLPSLFIRCNLKAKHLRDDPNSIPWPWPVEDLGKIHEPPLEGFKHDVTFVGWMSCETRKRAVDSCSPRIGLKYDLEAHDKFYGYVERDDPKTAAVWRKRFLDSVQVSRAVLAPRSIDGVFPYRFWEGMSAGRLTVLICSRYNLPWKDKIDWDRWCIRVDEEHVDTCGPRLKEMLSKMDDREVLERGRYGREMWLRWMNPANWAALMREAVEEKISQLGLPRK